MTDTTANFFSNPDALFGGLIGGGMAVIAVFISHKLSENAAKKRETMHVRGILQAIHDEIEILWKVYSSVIGDKFESLQDGKPFLIYWPVNQNYFTVYENNAEFIGKIKDNNLRKQIVTTYTLAKSLIDSFCFNNTMVQKWDDERHLFLEKNSPVHKARRDSYHQVLVVYAVSLNKLHVGLKTRVSELLLHIKEEDLFSSKK